MRVHQYLLAFVLLIGSLTLIGTMIISGASNHEVEVSDNFSKTMTGENYDEYSETIENIEAPGVEDGFLGEYRVARNVFHTVRTTFSQAGAVITTLGGFLGLPAQLVALFVTMITVMAVFATIYFLRRG